MSLQSSVKKGDWVKLTSTSGSSVVGQAAEDLSLGGPAQFQVVIGGDRRSNGTISEVYKIIVNVNFWTVEVLMGNMVGQGARDER